ncbi:MAG: hypothetical protein M1814_003754 [Vezdaea aestivalis]|nr:MAG: hypothetical protein M1814_003754 [Vezdaea aestivalis]
MTPRQRTHSRRSVGGDDDLLQWGLPGVTYKTESSRLNFPWPRAMGRRVRDVSLILLLVCFLGLLVQRSTSAHLHIGHPPGLFKNPLGHYNPKHAEDSISLSDGTPTTPDTPPDPYAANIPIDPFTAGPPQPTLESATASHPALESPTPPELKLDLEPEADFPKPKPTIEKLSMLFGDYDPVYDEAVELSIQHAERHGYSSTVLRHEILDYMWNKPALVMHRLLGELMKPNAADRIEWFWWFDSDTVVLNPSIPLEMFHPPPALDDITILVANDFNGLNFGAFGLRVCPEAVTMMAAIIAYRFYRPDASMTYHEQSAMSAILGEEMFWDSVIFVPQRWFNAYRPHATQPTAEVRSGDFLVHLAGVGGREGALKDWLQYARLTANDTISSTVSPELESAVHMFYDRFAEARGLIMEAEVALDNLGTPGEADGTYDPARELASDVVELRRLLSQDPENTDAIRLTVEDVGRGVERVNHRPDLNPPAVETPRPQGSVPMPVAA